MHDLITIGEVLLRLAIPSPARFETAQTLDIQIGGAEANVAGACARLGLRVAWISAVPANPWGERVLRELAAHGVDCAYVRRLDGSRLGVYFLEYGVPPRPIRILYDRRGSAFAQLTVDDVDWQSVRQAKIVHVSGVTPALGDASRALVRRAIAEAPVTSFDVNYRASLWSTAEARRFIDQVLPTVRYLFLGEAEARDVFGQDGPPERMLEATARLAPKATITLMRGEDGAVTLDGGTFIRPSRRIRAQVIDPIGAGDAFVGGFLWSVLRDRSVHEAVDAGSAVAALKCSMWGDIARISVTDVEDALSGGPDVRR